MPDEILKRGPNSANVSGGVTDDVAEEVRMFRVDPVTGAMKVGSVSSGSGTIADQVSAQKML